MRLPVWLTKMILRSYDSLHRNGMDWSRECLLRYEHLWSPKLSEIRQMVYDRSGGYCERCAIPLAESWALHHRKLRSRGGKDEITNLVALHHHCHNIGTDSVHLNPDAATREGFMVPSWDEPSLVPVTLGDGRVVLLTHEGGYRIVEGGNGW